MFAMEIAETYSRTDISTIDEHTEPTSQSMVTFSDIHSLPNRKKSVAAEISINIFRDRLYIRNLLFIRLAAISKILAVLAVFSIILMIIANELTFNRVNDQNTKASWWLKLIISLTTAILLVLILFYHYLNMTFYAYRNRLKDWRVQLTCNKIFFILLELFICLIHPVPRAYPYTDPPRYTPTDRPPTYVPIDVALGLPMFLRLYLVGRSFIIKSPFVRRLPLRSLGYFNHVIVNSSFLLKICLAKGPRRCIVILCILTFLIGSWSLRACVYTSTGRNMRIADAMWLFIVTATTVGYGDVYPSTYLGRSVATVIALFGLFFSALITGLVIQALQLTSEEKSMYTFVSRINLAKERRHQAANVVKFAVKSWYIKRLAKFSSISYLYNQQKLLHWIKSFQKIRRKQQHLRDNDIDSPEEIPNTPPPSPPPPNDAELFRIKLEMKEMKNQFNRLNDNLLTLQDTLNLLVNKLA